MNRSHLVILLLFASLFLTYCSSTRKAAVSSPIASTFYEADVKSLVESKCSPCHIPAKGGNKEAFDTYEGTKANIDAIITRIELNPGDKGFMPFKHPKLSDSAINVFKKWRAEGLVKAK